MSHTNDQSPSTQSRQAELDVQLASPEATARVAHTLAGNLRSGDLVVLTGELLSLIHI